MNYYYIKYEFWKKDFNKIRFLFIESEYDLSYYLKDSISQIKFIRKNIKEKKYNLDDYYINIKDIQNIDRETFFGNYYCHQNQFFLKSYNRAKRLLKNDISFIESELEGIFLWYKPSFII